MLAEKLGVVAGILLVFLLVFFLIRALKRSFWVLLGRSSEPNPFCEPCERRTVPLVTDQKERDRVLKQNFSPDKVPPELDVIVIGSGMGGLSTAAILAKAGKRVLVLEQHDQAGGCCHTFVDKGFEFDTGIHYIGEMAEGTISHLLVDQLSNCGIEWVKLEEVYDTAILGFGGKSKPKSFPIPSGRYQLIQTLTEAFPDEEKAIREYFDLLKRMRRGGMALAALKLIPRWFALLLVRSGLVRKLVPILEYYHKSLSEVLYGITGNQELKALLAYNFGNYGTIPKEASFGMHAALANHFTRGGYYPKGGASEIAFNIIPTIEKAGGKVLVHARVTDILMDEDMNRTVGVRVKRGHNVYEIMAPLVISDAGVHNTFEQLLPSEVVNKFGLERILSKVKHGVGLLSVFVGLDGTKEELGLQASNVWAFNSANLDELGDGYLKLSPEEAEKSRVPLMFLSFPSAKDPTYNTRYPGKSTCAIITVAPYEWFENWKDEKVMHRGDDYQGLKMAIGRQLWNQVCELFPQLEDKLEYLDVGSPLSNQHYLGTPRGEVYGIDHDTVRFSPEMIVELRPEIGVPGLFLTGQDILVCGFSGAMYGGMLCASAVLKRNITADLIKLKAKVKKDMEAKKD